MVERSNSSTIEPACATIDTCMWHEYVDRGYMHINIQIKDKCMGPLFSTVHLISYSIVGWVFNCMTQ